MTAAVCYVIEAVVEDEDTGMPYTVELPVRRVCRPSKREAGRLIRQQYPAARVTGIRRSVQAHAAWAASGQVRRKIQ